VRAARLARTPAGRVAGLLVVAATALAIGAIVASAAVVGLAAVGPPGLEWVPVGVAVLGSLAVAGAAALVATPVGVGLAVWVQWIAPPAAAGPARQLLLGLGAVPPAAYAVAGLTLPGSWSPYAAAVALSLVALPAIVARSLRVLVEVPRDELLQAVALGATWGQAVGGVGLPAAAGSLARAVAIGLGRAVGDTLIVLLLLGAAGAPERALPGLVVVRASGGVLDATVALPALVLGAVSVALVLLGRRAVRR
jgi:phosphate transport system permease protein